MNDNKVIIKICDDENIERAYLSSFLRKWAADKEIAVQISEYESAENFLFHYEEDKAVDILLLDIQMKEMNGIELARRIRDGNESVQIIFITGFPDFMAEGYDVSALHYLMKPIKEEKLRKVLDKALSSIKKTDRPLFLTIDGEMHMIPFSGIRLIEAQGHYVIIKTTTRDYKAKKNLSDIQTSLDETFFRCQRSFIINLRYVHRITRTSVILDNSEEVPLSRSLYEAANQAIINYFP